MNFKDVERHRREWWDIHPKLRLILCDIDYWCFERGVHLIVTQLLRSDEEQADLYLKGMSKNKWSVHQFGRGADVRPFLDPGIRQQCADYVNAKYVYDVTRPQLKTMIWHGGSAEHGHVQVADRG